MRLSLLLRLLAFKSAQALLAEPLIDVTALGALKQLPCGEAKKVALIEGREGSPVPERWYILVNDAKDENGLHEYVVAGGELVASRHVSQFAEILRPADVFGGEPLRVDSDRAAKIARQYANANDVTIASMNFELKKGGGRAVLIWNVTCLDQAGKELGHVHLAANRGDVVSHEGFAVEPSGIVPEKLKTQAPPEVAAHAAHTEHAAHAERAVRGERTTQAALEPEKRADFFHRLGGTMQKIFTGSDSRAR
jgi:hypothetical protein